MVLIAVVIGGIIGSLVTNSVVSRPNPASIDFVPDATYESAADAQEQRDENTRARERFLLNQRAEIDAIHRSNALMERRNQLLERRNQIGVLQEMDMEELSMSFQHAENDREMRSLTPRITTKLGQDRPTP
jgi:hypothetical protein